MIKRLILLFVLFQVNNSISQEIETEIKGKKIDYFVNVEKKLKSELFRVDPLSQLIIYKRKEKDIPDLLVKYSYNKIDSIVCEIQYDWDVYNFEKKENNFKSEDYNKSFILKYESLLKILVERYGKSKSSGSLKEIKNVNTEEGLSRRDYWIPKNDLEVEIFIKLSNYYKKERPFKINPEHFIRIFIKQKKNKEIQIGKFDLVKCNENFETFLKKLKESNFKEAKILLSNSIKNYINDVNLLSLQKIINFNSNLILINQKFEESFAGKKTLNYKYENDDSTKTFNITFDEENKILNIQPPK